MNELINALPAHPLVLAVVATGAVAMALRAIWVNWISPSVFAIKGAIEAARDIADLLRDIRDFFQEQLPALVHRVDGIADALDEHIATEDARVLALEQRSVPTEGQ